MAITIVALNNTFDEWRTRTNQLITQSNYYETNLPTYPYANNIGVSANSFASATIAGANTAVGAGANAYTDLLVTGANANASNATYLTIGIVPGSRMSGSYTGITGVGTITTGVWNGTVIPVSHGGTGGNDQATARTGLGLVIGTNVQAWDANLDQIAALAPTDNNFIVGNGTAWTLETPSSARTSLGLGTIATQGSGAVTITGGSITGITDITLADGGTNASLTASAGAVAYSTASALALSGVGTSGQVLTSAGTSAPTWTAQTALSVGNASQLGGVAAASYARKDTAQYYSGRIDITDGSGVITLQPSGDIYAYRSGGTTGVLFLNSAGSRYLYNDGTDYQMPIGGLVVGGDITAFASDERLKKDIVEIQNPLEKISQIRGVHYRHNDFALEQGLPDEAFVGVIAQEIEKVLPEVVTLAPFDYEGVDSSGKKISKSGENYKTVKYDKIVPLLIEAIKELSSQVESMKLEIEELKK
jgi:hypothetical protein